MPKSLIKKNLMQKNKRFFGIVLLILFFHCFIVIKKYKYLLKDYYFPDYNAF